MACLASPTKRWIAVLTDGLFLSLFVYAGGILGAYMGYLMTDSELGVVPRIAATTAGFRIGVLFWGLVSLFINYMVLQGFFGASVGKLIWGIKIVNKDGTSAKPYLLMARFFAYWVSAAPLMLGFSGWRFSKLSQCWHDWVCDTIVVDIRSQNQTVTVLTSPPVAKPIIPPPFKKSA